MSRSWLANTKTEQGECSGSKRYPGHSATKQERLREGTVPRKDAVYLGLTYKNLDALNESTWWRSSFEEYIVDFALVRPWKDLGDIGLSRRGLES